MIKAVEDFYTESEECVTLFDKFVAKHELFGRGGSDHICYKCGSIESFEFIRALFENESEYIYQTIISKRRIAVIKLRKGIVTSLGEITVLELSDQKPDNSQKEGFDHIEVYPVGQTYEDMVAELEKTEVVKKVERPHHTTHDIDMGNGFLFRCTEGSLIEKIKNSEMV
jgi:hypothetical protein